MVVWIRIRLRSRFCDKSIETSAILNSSFGHPYPGTPSKPIVRLPYRLARELCINRKVLEEHSHIEVYDTAGGPVELYLIPDCVDIELIGEGKTIKGDAIIDEHADTVLLNDRAISTFEIVILDPAEGIWTLKKDMKPRQSSEPEFW